MLVGVSFLKPGTPILGADILTSVNILLRDSPFICDSLFISSNYCTVLFVCFIRYHDSYINLLLAPICMTN